MKNYQKASLFSFSSIYAYYLTFLSYGIFKSYYWKCRINSIATKQDLIQDKGSQPHPPIYLKRSQVTHVKFEQQYDRICRALCNNDGDGR